MATILINTHARRLKQEALYALHDFSAWATYRDSEEASAMAKEVTVQAAMDTESAENATKHNGAGACVLP